MRVVIADDSALLREGLVRLLVEAGIEVAGAVADGPALEAAVAAGQPDVAIIDIRMPPSFTHEGAETATRLRNRWRDSVSCSSRSRSKAASPWIWRAPTPPVSAIC